MNWLEPLLSTQTPVLPAPWVAQLYLGLGWGLVLACAGVWLVRRLAPGRAFGSWAVAAVLLLWCLWPGPLSPAYWLGLAFRAPSLMSAVLCMVWLRRQWKNAPSLPHADFPYAQLLGVALGWLLLLDTFAIWPGSLYALGFSPLLLGLVVVAAGLPWALRGARATFWAGGAGGVLLLFVLLRLPSGNLWDALLDPWLWLLLHLRLARRPRRQI